MTLNVYIDSPRKPWCQCGILDHLGIWRDLVVMTLREVCEREMLEAPPGIHVSLTPLCARFLMCSDVKI